MFPSAQTTPFSLQNYPSIPSSLLSASLPSAKRASEENEALPRRLVVANRSPWCSMKPPSCHPYAANDLTQSMPAKDKCLRLVIDTELANSYQVLHGDQKRPLLTNPVVLPAVDDHYNPAECNIASFPWQLFPEPPSPISARWSELTPSSTTFDTSLETLTKNHQRASLSLQSDASGASTVLCSPTRSFFQLPYMSRTGSNPYTYSSSDVFTIPDTWSEEIDLSACVTGGGAEDDGQVALAADNTSDPFRHSSFIDLDGTESKRFSALLFRNKSRLLPNNRISIPKTPFDEYQVPTREQLSLAASLCILDENGSRIRFGDLWEKQRTVVCFIRNFWCPMCQDYIFSIMRSVPPPSSLARHNPPIGLVIISNGSPHMIASYKRIFGLPFSLYVDPTLAVYHALGMTKRTMSLGPDVDKGSYIKHSFVGGLATVAVRSVRHHAPVWRGVGDLGQLGGEFVLGPATVTGTGEKRGEADGRRCFYAHRMTNMRSHRPIVEVMKAAGLDAILRAEEVNENIAVDAYDNAGDGIGDSDYDAPTTGDHENNHESEKVQARTMYLHWLRDRKKSRREGQWGPSIGSSNRDNKIMNSSVDAVLSEDEEYLKACIEYADACGLEDCSFLDI